MGEIRLSTIKDVARQAGVSVATVSHVLNGTRFVREETRERVESAIASLDYVSNRAAASLRTGRTQTFGLIMSAVMNPYFNDVVTSIEDATVANGYSLLLADHRDESELEYRSVLNLCTRKVDGLLMQPSGDPSRALQVVRDQRVPTVFVDRFDLGHGVGGHDFSGTENYDATIAVVRHLIDHGHRRIGMVCGQAGSSTTEERLAGYRAALDSAGLPLDPTLIEPGHSDETRAEQATHALLNHPDPPTALFSGNNRMTIGIMQALRARGIVPPEGIALGVFDDFPWADLFSPRLTCVAQQTDRIGAASVALLLRRIAEPDRPAETVRFTTELRRRDSCGCR
ncbi:LacI family DNA-binding transcriptional regulator [Nakamurella flavida]|uniref:LacI family DNA-binding transcriptional regulator n=1 Tax=Nakamurella flavida TaxID=363630 RepID=A0A938YR90_9ACTN|nr:LacI family DNA-binding transcriptional regulator [Nakamurella flavida]MBM9477979.1 LacI family DNA-binding transcriptional regulator [Nakamurella flavida]MDP9778305.1 LacI family transcriptional regulator [Nakamurella flavida]